MTLEGVGDLRVREADDVAEEKRHLEVGVEHGDRAPDGVDGLDPFGRRVDDLERRHVVQRQEALRLALTSAKLVEHAVLRDLEEPRREAAAERKAGEALVDPQEDLLREVFGECPVAHHAKDVVVDRRLVGLDDDPKRPLVATLRFAQYVEVGL